MVSTCSSSRHQLDIDWNGDGKMSGVVFSGRSIGLSTIRTFVSYRMTLAVGTTYVDEIMRAKKRLHMILHSNMDCMPYHGNSVRRYVGTYIIT